MVRSEEINAGLTVSEDACGKSATVGTLEPSHIIPVTCRGLLQVGDLPAALTGNGFRVADIKCPFEALLGGSDIPDRAKNVDDIVLGPHSWSQGELLSCLSRLQPLMGEYSQISILWISQSDMPFHLHHIDRALASIGLMRYRWGALKAGMGRRRTWAMVIVKSAYNPVAHARHLAAAGHPDGAIKILENIPAELLSSNDLIAQLALEKQKYYLAWQQCRGASDSPHALLTKERREFAQVTAISPRCLESYRVHAHFWNEVGRADMANRIWRSIDHFDSKRGVESSSVRALPEMDDQKKFDITPLWSEAAPPIRILIITHDYSDYGMDTLYHGLCQLLGQHNVVEFPWKPTLHGQNFEAAHNYPCVFHYPGHPYAVAQLEAELEQWKFDLIIYGDVVQMAHGEEVRRLINANPELPVVLYDTWDDCYTPVERLLRYIGRDRFDLMFKREMLDGVDYGSDTFPLPFGYALQQQQSFPQNQKQHSLFWAGKREYGLRPVYIPYIENRIGCSLDQHFDQAAYQTRLRTSRMGLSFFGCGFDSVRYWELPAHSVMLMAERPPIRIPHNFVDGQTAVFFDDLPELEAKLDYYLNHPDQIDRIATAGHENYLKYHTCQIRAKQILGRVDQMLGGRLSGETDADNRKSPGCLNTSEKPDLFLGLAKGENYGWGVCSNYLIEELSNMRAVHVLTVEDGSSSNRRLLGPVFQALTTVNFDPLFGQARGTRNYGYTFFENELTRQSIENAKRYDRVLAGSSWCRDRMLEAGITNCDILIQGIDPKRFHPITDPTSDDRFVIFSGGKFELRKGQDLVLRAVKILQDKYPDIHLVNCWYNLWPESLKQMRHSPHICFNYRAGESWQETLHRTYVDNGLDPNRITTMDLVPHEQLRKLYAQTDIAVFPNRCEGGTNLVLMEYMACAKPVIATATSGHNDIVSEENALLLRRLKDIQIVNGKGVLIGRWQEPSLDELVAQIEFAYHQRDATGHIARRAGEDLQRFAWHHCAQRLVDIIEGKDVPWSGNKFQG